MSSFEHPERLGPYRIVQVIGEGGMGVVYDAMQTEPVQRRVALKMIKAGMDSREVMRRFESEQHALAVMDHPGIAKVFDGGTTPEGRPYFAMELVRGIPLGEYCDTHRLGTETRIRLMIDVCNAVQHAHQKGVIHRDLKPGNILVTEVDGQPAPKVIDFGIAKAVGAAGLGDHTSVTRIGQMVGTPYYMSPEQAEMSGLDVDTRDDVYSLGMVLHELLTGALPFSEERSPAVAPFLARSGDSPPPSNRYSSLGDERNTLARLRSTDPPGLLRTLRGDIDWIVMKAIDPDRNRRYETASGVAADLQRFLALEPVTASQPTVAYRVRKFVRRNRAAVSASAAGAVMLVAFSAATLVQSRRIAEERDLRAAEAETAREVTEFLVQLFSQVDPSRARGNSIAAREVLDVGAERVRTELSPVSPVRGRLLETMGRVYNGLGLYDEVEELLLASVQDRELGPADSIGALSLVTLAWNYHREQRLDEALELGEAAVAAGVEIFGSDHLYVAHAHQIAGMAQRDLGRLEDGRASLGRALVIRRATLDSLHPDIGWNLHHLGWLEVEAGDLRGAAGLYEEARRVLETSLDPQNPQLAWLYNDMGVVHRNLGEHQEAGDLHERALALREATLGRSHPDVATALEALSSTRAATGDGSAAVSLQERANDIRRDVFGAETLPVARGVMNLGLRLHELGRFEEPFQNYRAALRVYESAMGPDDPRLIVPLANLGYLLRSVGETSQALGVLERAVGIGERAYGPTHPAIMAALLNLALAHQDLREYDTAIRYAERAFAAHESEVGEDNPLLVTNAVTLGLLTVLAGRPAEALDPLQRAVELASDTATSRIAFAEAHWGLGFAHHRLGNLAMADSLFEVARVSGEASGDFSIHAHFQLRAAAARGDLDAARVWLGAIDDAGDRALYLHRDPVLDPIRHLPDFGSLSDRIRDSVELPPPLP